MNVLLVYPRYPDTFWSFRHALKFVSRKAAFPPLGLLTVASLLPAHWNKRLVDLNVRALREKDLEGVDYVFLSAMLVQQESLEEVVDLCRKRKIPIVAGGPLFMVMEQEEFEGIDHLVLGEAEVTLPMFLRDLEEGKPKKRYDSRERPDLTLTPLPSWDLISFKDYATMPIQYSRGCPFNCDFCDIIVMNGRIPRTKSEEQMLRELDALYVRGWRGTVFIVDDNFIGNKHKVKKLLPRVIQWNRERRYPFNFITEASINLADDDELLDLMARANFSQVFLGIETPHEGSLAECNKLQNAERDLVASVKKIQNAGIEVMGGFIVGFDSDPPNIFERQIEFISKSGVVTAMVGVLQAVPGTRLYQRLKEQGRLLMNPTGNHTDGILNFIPKMDMESLINGYRRIIDTIYSPKNYYERVLTFLKEYRPSGKRRHFNFRDFKAFLKSLVILGLLEEGRRHYWGLLTRAFLKYRRAFPEAVASAIYGYHFRKVLRAQARERISH
jgi:radical SAM superfamily enzyme YgiQ (UPF0313 family)